MQLKLFGEIRPILILIPNDVLTYMLWCCSIFDIIDSKKVSHSAGFPDKLNQNLADGIFDPATITWNDFLKVGVKSTPREPQSILKRKIGVNTHKTYSEWVSGWLRLLRLVKHKLPDSEII